MQIEIDGPPFGEEGDEVAMGDEIRNGDTVWFERVGANQLVMRVVPEGIDGLRYRVTAGSEPGSIRLTVIREM